MAASKLTQAKLNESVGKLPLAFEPNQGQTDPQVKYIARAKGYTAFLTGNETVLQIKGDGVLAMKLQNARPASQVVSSDQQVGKSNYLIGNDRSKWHTNVPNFGKVTYRDVYQGVDVVYSGNQRNLEYDFVVKPGADAGQIRIAYEGSSRFALNAQGDLELQTAAGQTVAHKPLVYQTINGQRKSVQGQYVLTAKNEVGFKLGAYDASQTVVIDPTVTVLTALGSDNGADSVDAIFANSQGVFVAGDTTSTTGHLFPLTPLVCNTTGNGDATCASGKSSPATFPTIVAYNGAVPGAGKDAFIMRLSADGGTLIYSTFLGAGGDDIARGIAADAAGNAYVTGSTTSLTFPVTNGSTFSGNTDVFVAQVAANGQSLIYSTYFGGSDLDQGNAIAVDAAGNAYVGGQSASLGLVLVNPLNVSATTCTGNTSDCSAAFAGSSLSGGAAGTADGLVIKLSPTGTVLFSTYLGGSGADVINGIALDSSNNVYVAGTSTVAATKFPTTASSSSGSGTASNKMVSAATSGTVAFVTKINADLASIGYSDTIGVSSAVAGAETATGIAVNPTSGIAFISGNTASNAGGPGGTVTGVTVNAAGSGYTSAPTVSFTGVGSGAAATAVIGVLPAANTTTVAGGVITGVAAALGGSGLTGTVTVTIPIGTCATQPTATATLAGGIVTAVNITGNGGSACTAGAAVNFSGGGAGTVTAVNVTSAGVGYYTAPTVGFTGGAGSGATATAVINSTFGNFTLSGTQLPATTGTLNGAAVGGSYGYVVALQPTGKTASYLTYLMTNAPSGVASVLNGIALDDANQAYVIGSQYNGSDLDIYTARLNAPGPVVTFGTQPGSIGFSGLITGTGGAASDLGNAIAVSTAAPLRYAFFGGSSSATTSIANGNTFASTPPLNYLFNSGHLQTGTTGSVQPKAPSDAVYGAVTFRDLVPSSTSLAFSSTSTAGSAGTNQSQTVTVTSVGGGAPPCTLGFINKTGAFFSNANAGTVTAASGSSFTVTTGTQNVPALGTPATGSFTIVGASGCPSLEPVTVSVGYSSSTAYTANVTRGSLTVTTPVGLTTGLPLVAAYPQITVAAASSIATDVTVGTPTSASGWKTACAPFTIAPGLGQTVTTPGTVYTLTPVGSCFQAQVPGTYTANISVAPSVTGAAAITVPYTVVIQSGWNQGTITSPGTPLSFAFSSNTAAPTQQVINLSSTGSTLPYTTTITNGTIPAGALTIASGSTGSVPSGGNATIVVQVNPAGVATGTYSGTVTVKSGTLPDLAYTINVSVGQGLSAALSANPPSVSLTGTTLSASLPAGLGSPFSIGTVTLNSVSGGAVQASAPTITYTSGTGWLTDSNSSACANVVGGGCTQPLSITTTSLAAGTYSATLGFTSTTTGVAPLNITVNLTVTSGSTFLQGASATPTGVVFINKNGTVTPATSVLALNVNAGTVSGVSITPQSTGNWLLLCAGGACTPGSGDTVAITGHAITAGTPDSFVIGVNSVGLAAGRTYQGSITVRSTVTGSATGNLVIPVSLVVTPQNPSAVGIFRNGLWLLDSNFNNTFDGADIVTAFGGVAGDIPVVGDWNGSGTSKIGIYRNGTWLLDFNGDGIYTPGIDRVYTFGGQPGDIPVVGDWNGTGYSKIGVFRQGFFWVLDVNGNGTFDGTGTGQDAAFAFGGATGCTAPPPGIYAALLPAGACDIPVVGDWNNSGTTKVGVVRGSGSSPNFLWILDTTGAQAYVATGTNKSTVFAFGGIQGDVPIIGDWTNAGTTNVGVFRAGFFWVENTTFAVPAFGTTPPAAADTLVAFPYGGVTGDVPVVGRWR